MRTMLPGGASLPANPTVKDIEGLVPAALGKPKRRPERLNPYVNEGRWVTTCLNCNGGIAVAPDIEWCACRDCGSMYKIVKPDRAEVRAAERVLSHREPGNRNWHPGKEKIRDLKSENAKQGVRFV